MIIQIINASPQTALLISGVVAEATGFTGTGLGSLAATTNGVGLPFDQPSLTGTHALSTTTNSWRSAPNNSFLIANLKLEFAFNRTYNLSGFSFWNLSGSTTFSNQGIKDATIEYRLNTGSWTALPISTTNTFTPGSTTGAATVQQFNFAPVYATQVRFRNLSNFGGLTTFTNRVGLNEIQFTSIPEPSSTLALLALGLAGVGLRKRV